ncbi:hypothetical protein SIM22_03155 [Bacillus cereus group sp. BfR-BA-01363]|uniref:hypothetical protein n=1 Tax=Bacillus cereus group sp. BfR-BA-01363 TaxID=3094882 RepID=UPI0029C1B6D9|nr:hypothetical protein [Bacillus cereus group sp. BfR-BA-01363]MDX5853121.1 hypothetical protein [Bacillus cereus group sp. BfR-BA-01363]
MKQQNTFNKYGQNVNDILSGGTKKGKSTISDSELNRVVNEENLGNIQQMASDFLTDGVKHLPEIRERMKAMGMEGQLDTVLKGLGISMSEEMKGK